MNHEYTNECSCPEYQELSRRGFLGAGSTAVAAATLAAITPSWVPKVAYAKDHSSGRDILVNVFLRGGADALSMAVPLGDPDYAPARPTQLVPSSQAKPLDSFFAFSAPMFPLLTPYNAGDLLVVHATGSPDPTRSHFTAMKVMELGIPNQPYNSLFSGWIGRHLHGMPPARKMAAVRAIALTSTLPKSLLGAPQALAMRDPSKFDLQGRSATLASRRQLITEAYENEPDPVGGAALDTFDTIDLLKQIDFANYQPANQAVYPTSTFGKSLKSAAALIKADAGVEVIEVDRGSWDTHSAQGTLDGTLAASMGDLATSLEAFYLDVIAADTRSGILTNRVTVVILSEFGRRIEENGSGGTDHGHGGMMMAMGKNIAGGRVLTRWPGLDVASRYSFLDLKVTIDYRDILSEILFYRLGNSNLGHVFPDYKPEFQGATR